MFCCSNLLNPEPRPLSAAEGRNGVQGGSARRPSPDSNERGELTVGTDVLLAQGAAGRGGQAHRECEQIGLVVAPGIGEVGELVHDAHDAPARGSGQPQIRRTATPRDG